MPETAAVETPITPTPDAGAQTAPVVVSDPAAPATPPADAAKDAPAGTVLTDPPKDDTAAEPAKPVVPEKYELKLPESPTLDQAALDRTAAFARERGLSNEAAQAALELANTEAKAYADQAHERFLADYAPGDPAKNIPPGKAWTQMQENWRAQSLADPEIGNGKPEQFDAAVKQAGKAFERFASEPFRELLRTTGYGSHPELVKVFAKIGAAMGEGTFVTAGAESAGRLADTDVFYAKK